MIMSSTITTMHYRQTSGGIRLLLLLNRSGGNRLNASTTSSSSGGTTTTRAPARNSKIIMDNNDKPVVDELQQEQQQTAQQKEQSAAGNGGEEPMEIVRNPLQFFERQQQQKYQWFAELLDKNNRNLLLPIGQLDSRLAKLEASVMLMGQQQLSAAAGNAGKFDGEWRPRRFIRLFVWLFNRAMVIVVCILLLDNIFDEKEPKQSLLYKLSLLPASYKKAAVEWYNSARKEKSPNVRVANVVGNSLNGDAGKCSEELLILADGVTVVNRATDNDEISWIRTKLPFTTMPSGKDGISADTDHTIFYYEVQVNKYSNNGAICLVLTEPKLINKRPDTPLDSLISQCKRGDVFGCGLVVMKAAAGQALARRLFFTKDGKIYGEPQWLPSTADKLTQLYPTICLRGQGTAVKVNFGTESVGGKPFRYNLAKHPGLELEK